MKKKILIAAAATSVMIAGGAVGASALVSPALVPAANNTPPAVNAGPPGSYPGSVPTTCQVSANQTSSASNGGNVSYSWSVILTGSPNQPPSGNFKFRLEKANGKKVTTSNSGAGTGSTFLANGSYNAKITYTRKNAQSVYQSCSKTITFTVNPPA